MSASVNKVILVGNLGADPDIRYTEDGRSVANFSVATSESWKDKNTGDRIERTEWHRIAIFAQGLAKVAEQYLYKGAKVYLEGQLKTSKWQDKDGNDRYSTDVVLQGFNAKLVMLDGGNRNGGSATETSAPAATPAPVTPPLPAIPSGVDVDDDIPF